MACNSCRRLKQLRPSVASPELPPGVVRLASSFASWLAGCDACGAVWVIEQRSDGDAFDDSPLSGAPVRDQVHARILGGWQRRMISRDGFPELLKRDWDELPEHLADAFAKELVVRFPDLCAKAARGARGSVETPFLQFREYRPEHAEKAATEPEPDVPAFFSDARAQSIVAVDGDASVIAVVIGVGKGRRKLVLVDALEGRKRWESEVFPVVREAPDDAFVMLVADGVVVHAEGIDGEPEVRLVAHALDGGRLWDRKNRWFSRTVVSERTEAEGTTRTEREVHNHVLTIADGLVFSADQHDLVAWRLADGTERVRVPLGDAWFSGTAVPDGDSLRFLTVDGTGTRFANGRVELEKAGDFWGFVTPEGVAGLPSGDVRDVVRGWRERLPFRLDHAMAAVGDEAVLVSHPPGPFVIRRDGMRMPAGPPLNWPVRVLPGGFAAKAPENDAVLLLDAYGRMKARFACEWPVKDVRALDDGSVAVLSRRDGARVEVIGPDGQLRHRWSGPEAGRLFVAGPHLFASSGAKLVRIPRT